MWEVKSNIEGEKLVAWWPNEVAVPINWGGSCCHASLKLSPSPKDISVNELPDLSCSKRWLRLCDSSKESSAGPGAGSGGSKKRSSPLLTSVWRSASIETKTKLRKPETYSQTASQRPGLAVTTPFWDAVPRAWVLLG